MRKRHRKGRFEQSERTLGRAAETGRPTPKAKARIDRCDDQGRGHEAARRAAGSGQPGLGESLVGGTARTVRRLRVPAVLPAQVETLHCDHLREPDSDARNHRVWSSTARKFRSGGVAGLARIEGRRRSVPQHHRPSAMGSESDLQDGSGGRLHRPVARHVVVHAPEPPGLRLNGE